MQLNRVQLQLATHHSLNAFTDIVFGLVALGETVAVDHGQLDLGFWDLFLATLEQSAEGVQELDCCCWEVHYKVVECLELVSRDRWCDGYDWCGCSRSLGLGNSSALLALRHCRNCHWGLVS